MSEKLFTVWIHPNLGEPITVTTLDFDSEEAALAAVADSFASGTPLRLREHERGAVAVTTLVVNPANVVAIRVRSPESADAATGQYL